MVDVSAKPLSVRTASASAELEMKSAALDALMDSSLPKGDALAAARIGGIQAAKRTGELIPLCHALTLDWVGIEVSRISATKLRIECCAKTAARTGVEMEALVGAAGAALTIYDMAKSADKSIVIGPIQLEKKTGGARGTYRRQASSRRG